MAYFRTSLSRLPALFCLEGIVVAITNGDCFLAACPHPPLSRREMGSGDLLFTTSRREREPGELLPYYGLNSIWPQFRGVIFSSKTASSTMPVCWLFQ